MNVSTGKKAPTEEFLRVVQSLNELAKAQGLSVHVTVPNCEGTQVHAEDATDDVKAQLRAGLAWLENELRENDAEFTKLRGNYVAVHDSQIIAVSEDREIALLGATKALGNAVEGENILIVPICVPSEDSEQEWLDTKRRLGME
jgi:hypothetical protein